MNGTGTRASWSIEKGSTVAGWLELDIPWAVSQALRTRVHMDCAWSPVSTVTAAGAWPG